MLSSGFASTAAYRPVCATLAGGLRERGWRVITASGSTGRIRRTVDMLLTAWRARDRYRIAQVDVFSGAAFGWAALSVHLLAALGKPIVLTLHGGGLPELAERLPVERVLARAAAITAPAPMPPFDPIVIPNPLGAGFRHRQRDGVRPRLVWVRALHRLYAPGAAVEVVRLLRPHEPAVHLTLIGPDKDGTRARLRRTIAAAGLGEHITLAGGLPPEAIPARLDAADVFLNTSTVDNLPVSVVEALASGLCVVSTAHGGLPDLLAGAGLLAADPPAMAGAVRRLLRDEDLAARLSAAGKGRAAPFEREAVLTQWEALLRSVS